MYSTLDCTSDYLIVNGVLKKMPPAYMDTTQSYKCDYKDQIYVHAPDETYEGDGVSDIVEH